MTEKERQTSHTTEGTTEPDSENSQIGAARGLVNPFDNWRKRGHVRAEPEIIRSKADSEETNPSIDGK